MQHQPAEDEQAKPSVENSLVWLLVCAIVLFGLATLGLAIFESYAASTALISAPGAKNPAH